MTKVHMPVTREKIKNHFHYSLWKYLVLVVLCIFGWNLLYTTTSYRVPSERNLEFYAEGYETDETKAAMTAMLERIHREVTPEMEAVSYSLITLDETYASMQLTVWISAGQGDIFLLQKELFQSFAANGAMIDLAPYIESGALNVDGLDLSGGLVADGETKQKVQYGIPANALTGLWEVGAIPEGTVLSVLANTGNEDASIRFVNDLLTHMR